MKKKLKKEKNAGKEEVIFNNTGRQKILNKMSSEKKLSIKP